MLTQSVVVEGSSRRFSVAKPSEMTDHVCAWAAASPARYRASSSAKAASKSSTSNDGADDPIVVVDLDDAEQLEAERLGRWSPLRVSVTS